MFLQPPLPSSPSMGRLSIEEIADALRNLLRYYGSRVLSCLDVVARAALYALRVPVPTTR